MTGNFFETLIQLTEHHYQSCVEYRSYVDTIFPTYKSATTLAGLPWLPARAFKNFRLVSVPETEIFKTMFSSGTTGLASRIILDRRTAQLQQKKLVEIFTESFEEARFPMLVIDNELTVKNRDKYSARTAAINGFSMFSRGRTFALDEQDQLDIETVKIFLEKYRSKRVFIFGFTAIVWEQFIKKALKLGIDFDFSNAFLIHGGGWKKLESQQISQTSFKEGFKQIANCHSIFNYYGMIEQTGSIYIECEYGNLHAPKGSDVIIRRPSDFEVAEFGEEGFIQLFSNIQWSYPGHSILTEDIGTSHAPGYCCCNHPGTVLRVMGRVKRAEVRGCSDAVN